MAAAKARYGSFIFRRPGSANWYIKLRSDGKRIEKSLGTSDRAEAEIKALKGVLLDDGSTVSIATHKAALLAARPRLEKSWAHQLTPGLHEAPALIPLGYKVPEGGRIFASDRELHYLDASGATVRTEPNGMPALRLVGRGPEAARLLNDFAAGKAERPTVPTKNADDAILETYIKDANLSASREREAREMWRIFRAVVDKPLSQCGRDDGRAIIKYLEDQWDGDEPLKSATLRRRMVPLVAAVNLAIDEGKHKGVNPFASVVTKRDDKDERDAFDDNDMKKIRANLDNLKDADAKLLLRIVVTMGVRRGEAFEIDREYIEGGIRYCKIGADKGMPKRRLPFPKDLLPHLPAKITGPLITGRKDTASKRLREFLEQIGVINDEDGRNIVPVHSARHRAKNRLREITQDDELRNAVGGWTNKKNSGEDYGKFSIKALKKAIDKIGF
jgi:hypothetical protein